MDAMAQWICIHPHPSPLPSRRGDWTPPSSPLDWVMQKSRQGSGDLDTPPRTSAGWIPVLGGRNDGMRGLLDSGSVTGEAPVILRGIEMGGEGPCL